MKISQNPKGQKIIYKKNIPSNMYQYNQINYQENEDINDYNQNNHEYEEDEEHSNNNNIQNDEEEYYEEDEGENEEEDENTKKRMRIISQTKIKINIIDKKIRI